jgi:photosystem II stability/assembly factor-like uncharacterized protein
MTQPRDPIEDWLGADVELLPPRPGGFERVHRAARRRKAMRAAGTMAGAAVVIAAAVIAPQVAGALLPHGSQPAKVTTGSASPSPSHHRQTPPAKGFRPTSVTFVDNSKGAVIGQRGAIAATGDYGRTWHRVGRVGPGVSQIRLLNGQDGWAFGPALYATHNRGTTWKRLTMPGQVIDLSTVGHRAFAVVANATGGFTLYSAPGTTDAWRPVPGATSSTAERPGGLQLTGQNGYLLTAGGLLAGPVTGGAWHQVPVSATTPGCLRGPGRALLAPAPDGRVFLACGATRLTAYTSVNVAAGWLRLGSVTTSGTPMSLAVAPASDALVLATNSGLSYSTDGRTWRSVHPLRGGFTFVGMTTQFQGVAVPANSALHEIFTTADGGVTWQRRPIQG